MIDVVRHLELHVLGGNHEAHGSAVGKFGQEPNTDGDVVSGALILDLESGIEFKKS